MKNTIRDYKRDQRFGVTPPLAGNCRCMTLTKGEHYCGSLVSAYQRRGVWLATLGSLLAAAVLLAAVCWFGWFASTADANREKRRADEAETQLHEQIIKADLERRKRQHR